MGFLSTKFSKILIHIVLKGFVQNPLFMRVIKSHVNFIQKKRKFKYLEALSFLSIGNIAKHT